MHIDLTVRGTICDFCGSIHNSHILTFDCASYDACENCFLTIRAEVQKFLRPSQVQVTTPPRKTKYGENV